MTYYEVRDTTGKVYEIADTCPVNASWRIAELHGVAIEAWRESRRPTIRVGMGSEL